MIEIDGRDFGKEVLESKLPVFACFTTEWCQSCYPTCLISGELVKEYDGSAKFIRLDIEKSPEMAERYHVIAVPTVILFRKSQEVKRLLGFHDKWLLRRLVNSAIDENE